MKKILSLMLALFLLLGIFQTPVNASAGQAELKPLPEVGQVVSGFKTIEVGNMDLTNSKTVLFEHEKTGARLVYIQNKDVDRSFDISFKTPAVDNTGVNHILEHISVSGSKKYPLRNVLFTVANQTYSTYINAMTAQSFTTYPVSSMSEAQLLKLTDVYLDCVFHPSVYDDKNIFKREAWRYEMADEKSPLNITGTVYNEMKGALGNLSTAAQVNVLRTLFPNSNQSTISGGDPDYIKNLTYDQLIKTHQTYYHPSNALMVLYGNLDYEKFLKMINDEYLSKYDKKDIKIDNGKVAPLSKKTAKTFKFPVSASTNTKNASEIDYAYALNDISQEDALGMSILTLLLNQQTSPLQKAFRKSNIGGNVVVSYNDSSTQPTLIFIAQNADEKRAADFQKLVNTEMSGIVKNGLDKDAIDAVISSQIMQSSNLTEAGNLGINLSVAMSQMWAKTDKTDYLNNLLQGIKSVGNKAKTGYLESLIGKYIINNNFAALITTVPEAGMAEKLDSQNKKALSDIKAKMSKQEISKIVADNKAYTEWNNKEDDEKVVDSLKAVTAADLPEEVKKYTINETKLSDGVRVLSAEANVGETENTSLFLDTSGVPIEKLHYLKLYSSLLGNLDTKNNTAEQLNTLNTRYLNGAGFSVDCIPQNNSKNYTPYMSISWTGLTGEYDKQIELVKDILTNTNFDNKTEILNNVKAQISNLKASFTNNPINLVMDRNLAQYNDYINYYTYLYEIDYYNFLNKLEKTLTEKPDEVIAELKSMNEFVLNKTNMITAFSGNKNYIPKYESGIKSIIDALPAKAITKQDYSKLPKPAVKEGIAVDSSVQYNMISATYDKMGTSFNGKYIPIGAFIKDKYITPKIRFGYGAYDNLVSFGSTGFYMASYRDPNIKETYDVYKGLSDFIKNTDITQKELDSYIIKSFGEYTMPSGELSGAATAIYNYLSGKTDEDNLKILREIKSLTVQDVKSTTGMFDKLLENGAYSTGGSKQKLDENKELFDSIITVDQSDASKETITRAQLIAILIPGVPNALDMAKQQGLISADSKGNYHENDKLTKEQLAVILYKIVDKYGMKLNGDEVKISDISEINGWAKIAVKALVNSGVMKLDDSGKFNPKDGLAAADIQTIITDLNAKLTGK